MFVSFLYDRFFKIKTLFIIIHHFFMQRNDIYSDGSCLSVLINSFKNFRHVQSKLCIRVCYYHLNIKMYMTNLQYLQ